MSINKKSEGDLADHVHRVVEISVKTPPKSSILLSTGLMATRGAFIPMPILIQHPPLQDQAKSGNRSMKTPTNFTDEPNTKALALMPMVEKQAAGESGGLGTKHFPSSCIIDYQDNNDSQLSFRDFTGGLKTPVPNGYMSDSDGHPLQSHKLMKREHDASSQHEKMNSNATKQVQLFLTLTEFDEDNGEDPNEDDQNATSYHAKDDDSDD